MRVNCPKCGAVNEAEPRGNVVGPVVCTSCRRLFSLEVEAPAPSPDLGGWDELGEIPGRKVPSFGQDLFAEAGFDLSELDKERTTESAVPRSKPTAPGRESVRVPPQSGLSLLAVVDEEATIAGGFSFDSPAESVETDIFGGGSEAETRVVNADISLFAREISAAARAVDAAPGWRVRSDRGVVYDLMTVDAVVAWLEGKPELAKVQIARGEGDFRAVDDFPEVTSRLPASRRVTAQGQEAPLTLVRETGRPTNRTAARPEAPPTGGVGIRGVGPKEVRGPKEVKRPPEVRSIGFGVVLALLLVAVGVVAMGSLAAVAADVMSLPPHEPLAAEPPEPDPSPELKEAIKAYESKSYTTAAQRLSAIASRDDPRVARYLALALYRDNRGGEAKDALEEYRRRMREHGRQVREVRH